MSTIQRDRARLTRDQVQAILDIASSKPRAHGFSESEWSAIALAEYLEAKAIARITPGELIALLRIHAVPPFGGPECS